MTLLSSDRAQASGGYRARHQAHHRVAQAADGRRLDLEHLAGAPRGHRDEAGPRPAPGFVPTERRVDVPALSISRASTSASSIAWQAPCPRFGVIGWVASPRSVMRPEPQPLAGSRS